MYGLLLVLHILVCVALILVILLQSGKGGGLAGGAFGGTAQTVFGGRGATDFLTRATMVLGGMFFLTSVILSLLSSGVQGPTRSLMQEEARRALPTAPQQGAPAGQQAPPTGSPQQPPGGQSPSGGSPQTPAPPGGGP